MLANAPRLAESFSRLKALVIGDVMLDRYLTGSSRRLCPEAPVPIVDVQERNDVPGGAGNCALNLARLGAQVEILGALGADCDGERLDQLLAKEGVGTTGVIAIEDRATLIKTRIVSGEHVIVRFDEGSTNNLNPKTEAQFCESICRGYAQADVIIISDYGYGVLTPAVIACLCELQLRHRKVIAVDSKRLGDFRELQPTLCKPNYFQALSLLGIANGCTHGRRAEMFQTCGPELYEATGARIVALTMDSDGALIFEDGQWPYRTYAAPVNARRTAGAGDTYLSAFTLALAAGNKVELASEIAAAAAAIVVEKPHTATCSLSELAARLAGEPVDQTNAATLHQAIRQYRERGQRIVFTNGCFDILHRGHIAYLEQAKRLGDILIVGVNTDESIQRLKGPSRPINVLNDRIRVLAALSSVDHVISFDEDTPHRLIEMIRPDVFVKGGDYTRAKLPEADLVEQHGGAVKILPFVADRSTTGIIDRICNAYHLMPTGADLVAPTTGAGLATQAMPVPS